MLSLPNAEERVVDFCSYDVEFCAQNNRRCLLILLCVPNVFLIVTITLWATVLVAEFIHYTKTQSTCGLKIRYGINPDMGV